MCLVTQSCLTLCNPMNCSLPSSSVHGTYQVRILEWVAMPSSRGSSRPRNGTGVSWIAGGFFTSWATREAQFSLYYNLVPPALARIFKAAVYQHVVQDIKYSALESWVFFPFISPVVIPHFIMWIKLAWIFAIHLYIVVIFMLERICWNVTHY